MLPPSQMALQNIGNDKRAKNKYGRRHRNKDNETLRKQLAGEDVLDFELADAEEEEDDPATEFERQCQRVAVPMKREEYVNSPPKDSLLRDAPPAHREKMYDAFLGYQKHLEVRKEWDMVEAVGHIWRRIWTRRLHLGDQGFDGPPVTCLLSDESQDLSPLQILLFALICPNPKGYNFALDSAQSITPGRVWSTARLKDLWHYMIPKILRQPVGDDEEDALAKQNMAVPLPAEVRLTQNFRAPQAVLNLAQSLVDLVQQFAPDSMDAMEPEKSYDAGVEPVFASGFTPKDLKEALLSGQQAGGAGGSSSAAASLSASNSSAML